MRKSIVAALLVFCLTESCNIPEDGDNKVPLSKVDLLNELADATAEEKKQEESENTLLLVAKGSEPGWFIELFKNYGRCVFDYGKDSAIVTYDFENLLTRVDYNNKDVEIPVNGKNLKLKINISNKTCIEESTGDKKPKSITINYNGKDYNGCAESPH